MKKLNFVFLLVVSFLLFNGYIVFAGGRSESKGENEVTVMLDWTPNVNHIGLFVAQEKGFFEDEGLSVNIIQPGEVFATAAVASEQVEFGIGFQEELTLLHAEENNLISIAAIFQNNTSGFAFHADKGITGFADLEGLRYAAFFAPYEQATIDSFMACAGADSTTIDFVPGGNDLLAMLETDLADFVWIFWGTQGFQAKRLGIDLDWIPMTDHAECVPDYYTPLIITNRTLAQENPELVKRFLRALSAAHDFVGESPQEAAEILAAMVPEFFVEELNESVPWLEQYLYSEQGWGWQDLDVWNDYAEWMYNNGLLDSIESVEDIDIRDMFTNQFLP